MPFTFEETQLPGVLHIEPKIFEDDRGYFLESCKDSDFKKHNIPHFVQDNMSFSNKGTLRGLHFQMNPYAQGKLVMCLEGEVFDVAVDIRKGSPTYGKWMGKVLSAKKKNMLYIPPGFAHGFYVISEKALFYYKNTAEYNPETARTLQWNDPAIDIQWPLEAEPKLSEVDQKGTPLQELENNFTF